MSLVVTNLEPGDSPSTGRKEIVIVSNPVSNFLVLYLP